MINTRSAVPVLTGLDAEVGFDVGATLKDYMRDCRLGHCHHQECSETADRRAARAKRRSRSASRPVAIVSWYGYSRFEDEIGDDSIFIPLTPDGRIDKRALRELHLFGSSSF